MLVWPKKYNSIKSTTKSNFEVVNLYEKSEKL